jgi:hypothetical protein
VDQPDEILSVSYIANRLISLRLNPELHPIPGDSRWGLIKMCVLATIRRFDVSKLLKIVFIIWFYLMAIAPKPLGVILSRWFLFPQERRRLNMLLRKLHLQPEPVEPVLKPT